LNLKILRRVFYIINSLENKKSTFLICKSLFKFKSQNLNKFNYIIFQGNKSIVFILSLIFFLIRRKIKFNKNFFFVYKKKNIYYGQEIFPKLPIFKFSKNFFLNLCYWFKNFFIILYLQKNIKFFFVKLDSNEITI